MEKREYHSDDKHLILIRRIDYKSLEKLKMSRGLGIFFHYRYEEASKTRGVLLDLCSGEGNIVTCAIDGDILAGYVTIVPPEKGSRWEKLIEEFSREEWATSEPPVCELGSIEVGKDYRRKGLAMALLKFLLEDPSFKRKIVFLRELSWHWDVKESGLSIYEYRSMLFHLFERVGFEYCCTDEEEVSLRGANMFMVRIGDEVPSDAVLRFCRLLCRSEPRGWGWG